MLGRVAWFLAGTAAAMAAAIDLVAQPQPELHTLPALTPVNLILDATISSNTHKRGDRFPIHVADDVKLNDVVVIPAGSAGEGEVVHAARSRVGGKAGELILAARYVVVDGREIRLRSFTAAGQGDDRTNAGLAVGIAVPPAIFLVRGGAFVMPQGTPGNAKTAEDVQLPMTASRAEPEGSASDTTSVPPHEEFL
jgi:hypothetical protein